MRFAILQTHKDCDLVSISPLISSFSYHASSELRPFFLLTNQEADFNQLRLSKSILFLQTMSPLATFVSDKWTSILSKFQPGKAQVLVASVPIYSHVEKLRVVAADLVERGYKVSFLTGSMFHESIEKSGARFIPLGGTADFDASDESKLWRE
jgi:hypothetical protein